MELTAAQLDRARGVLVATAPGDALGAGYEFSPPPPGGACGLGCHAIRRAVLTGALDARAGLEPLRKGSRRVWARRLEEAERAAPRDFTRNGWVVEALQAAWCAIAATPVPAGAAREER